MHSVCCLVQELAKHRVLSPHLQSLSTMQRGVHCVAGTLRKAQEAWATQRQNYSASCSAVKIVIVQCLPRQGASVTIDTRVRTSLVTWTL